MLNKKLTLVLLFVATLAQGVSAQSTSLRVRMLIAEDQRAESDADLAPLREGLTSRDPALRRQAVRAIGRLERADLLPLISRLLSDENIDVRAEAVNAVGQIGTRADGLAGAKSRLVARLKAEQHPRVRGVIAATLGRLSFTSPRDVQETEQLLAALLPAPAVPSSKAPVRAGRDVQSITHLNLDEVAGAVEGLEALLRQSGKLTAPAADTVARLRTAGSIQGRPEDADQLARIRRLARLALNAAAVIDREWLEVGAADSDDEVRRLTMITARAPGAVESREQIVSKGLADSNPRVRYEALQTFGRHFQKTSCTPVIAARRDINAHVSLLAIDLLGNGCPNGAAAIAALPPTAAPTRSGTEAWHAQAHALVALAKLSPAPAREALRVALTDPVWQIRMYAATAAGVLGAVTELEQLARDPHDNVREAAINQLTTLKRVEVVAPAIEALSRNDYQLIITAARALSGHDAARVLPPLFDALARLTAQRRDTSRDPRMAILARIADIGAPDGVALGEARLTTLRGYLQDFDPAIATRAAEILQKWQRAASPAPQPPAATRVTAASLDAMQNVRLRFIMAGKGAFDLRLFTDEAPLTALRVITRAREGYYNGLTFHRVVPNFVIQGGSPGANEYMGDGPYMRDEVGLKSHRRGTVGISTRGRDTGDAQIFINLVDLPRLDHTYTVFAEVIHGMDVVDAILEGDVIERVELLPSGSR